MRASISNTMLSHSYNVIKCLILHTSVVPTVNAYTKSNANVLLYSRIHYTQTRRERAELVPMNTFDSHTCTHEHTRTHANKHLLPRFVFHRVIFVFCFGFILVLLGQHTFDTRVHRRLTYNVATYLFVCRFVCTLRFYFILLFVLNKSEKQPYILSPVVGGIREIGFVFLGSAYSNEIGVYITAKSIKMSPKLFN